jgi:hypothetical protein
MRAVGLSLDVFNELLPKLPSVIIELAAIDTFVNGSSLGGPVVGQCRWITASSHMSAR